VYAEVDATCEYISCRKCLAAPEVADSFQWQRQPAFVHGMRVVSSSR
jgi:hypothetical protein